MCILGFFSGDMCGICALAMICVAYVASVLYGSRVKHICTQVTAQVTAFVSAHVYCATQVHGGHGYGYGQGSSGKSGGKHKGKKNGKGKKGKGKKGKGGGGRSRKKAKKGGRIKGLATGLMRGLFR